MSDRLGVAMIILLILLPLALAAMIARLEWPLELSGVLAVTSLCLVSVAGFCGLMSVIT